MLEITQRVPMSAILFALTAIAACGTRSALDDSAAVITDTCAAASATRAPKFHRACPASCSPNFTSARDTCTVDADCTDAHRCSNGQCTFDECLAPADCKGGKICTCATANPTWGANVCSPARCHSDSDCGSGGFCSPSPDSTCVSLSARTWRCHTANDSCLDDSDCAGGVCLFAQETGAWTCAVASHCGG